MGEGPIAHPHHPPDSGAQGPGARPKALSCGHSHLGWLSVGVGQLEKARATGLACRDRYSRLLTWSSLCSPGGPGVRSSLVWLVGRLYNGRVVALCCVRGYGRPREWRIMTSPTHGTPLPSRPLHAWLVWCWPACVRSVYCRVAFPAAVWLIHGCVIRLMVRLCAVWSIALQPALAQPDVALVVFSARSEVCCGWPVRCRGHCVATRGCPARCVGSPSFSPPVVGLSRVVRWPVWARPAMFGRCRPSSTPFISRRASFVVACPFVACPPVRLVRCCLQCSRLVLPVGRCLRHLMVGLSCCWMCWALVAV